MKRFAALFGLLSTLALCGADAEFEEPVRLRVQTDQPDIRNMTANVVTTGIGSVTVSVDKDPVARKFAATKTSAFYPLCVFTK